MEVQVVFSQQIRRFSRWLRSDIALTTESGCAHAVPHCADGASRGDDRQSLARKRTRHITVEAMEPRLAMTADPIWVGGVYVEEDVGSDQHGDAFHITFKGGAAGTEMTRLVIDGDLNTPGFGLGDLFFDTLDSGLGADHSYGFQIVKLETANPNATVQATVEDGSTKLILDFTNFQAGDVLVFSIDVDEVQSYDPNETDLAILNSGFDPITSGVEFQNSIFKAEFIAPNYENVSGQNKFLNRYDPVLEPSGLPLPADDFNGKRDRSAGTAVKLQQVPKPISLAGIVYVDNNYSLTLDSGEVRLANVQLELFQQIGGSFVSTGFKTTTNSQGEYSFGTDLKLQPGIFQVREVQPAGYLSVGATKGVLNGPSAGGAVVGQLVTGNPDWLTQIEIPLGDQHATQLNFAEAQPASIAGRVTVVRNGFDCEDANATEEPIANVTVELRDDKNAVVATTKTDANGNYRFDNLRAGNYTVRELTPPGYLEGDAHVGTISSRIVGQQVNGSQISLIQINGGNQGVNYDFCELLPSDVSGHVYVDRNNNGLRDGGENPIVGVTLILWNSSGTEIGRTTTDNTGFYKFDNLVPGTYRITEQQPSGYLPGKAAAGTINSKKVGSTDPTGDVIAEVAIPSGVHGVDYDFGEILPGSIAGRVIVDTNGNCIIDAIGEKPLAGVKVELLDTLGGVVQTTFTDSSGNYRFDNLIPGVFTVRETQPGGYFQGGQYAGSGGGDDDTQDLISQIVVNPGDALVDYLFCEIPPAELSGYVFVDRDADCLFDSGEQPIAGTTVTLYDGAGNVVGTATTDANGRYHFGNLRPGTYTVREQQPAGYLQGGQKAGSAGGNDTLTDAISAIPVGAGQTLTDYNFCEVLPASIQGQVFVDLDFDCLRDPEEKPLSGVKIELLNVNGQIVATTFTDADGQYSFLGLQPGTYSVRETQPTGYFQGGTVAPATGGDVSIDDLIARLVLGSGDAIREANFCEVPPARISGYVFQDGAPIVTSDIDAVDLNTVRDGHRTGDDKPIGQVRLQLRTVAGVPIDSSNAMQGVYTTQYIEVLTDANGYFEFNGLRAGAYNIYQLQPDGYYDGIDTPGSTGGFGVNKGQQTTAPQYEVLMQSLTMDASTDPHFDGLLLVSVEPNQHSFENNFSEVVAVAPPPPEPPKPPTPPAPPPENPQPPLTRPTVNPETFVAAPPLYWRATPWSPEEPLIGYGHQTPPTWHLSIINAGTPRGRHAGQDVSESEIAEHAELLDVYAWEVQGMQNERWTIVSRSMNKSFVDASPANRTSFNVPGGKPVAGDFNGDGFDELAYFKDGEWFVDLNGNGVWDDGDIWLKMGEKGDQPVAGDWDGDGKDDVGIFGRKWAGDDRALAAEPGLPDPENRRRVKPKNVPPRAEEAPEEPRLMKQGRERGKGRADLIDHVFRFGSDKDIAVTGDFNGDGISSIGIFNEGQWKLDVDGDGRFTIGTDKQLQFGDTGDQPIVGDFDGDGIDEVGIVRGRQIIIDANGNGRIDATDQVFMMDEVGTVIAGDFDGDGRDEPALLSPQGERKLEARRR